MKIPYLSDLSPVESFVLCYMAYLLEETEKETVARRLLKTKFISRMQIDEAIDSLEKKEMVEPDPTRYYWSGNLYSVSDRWLFPVLCLLRLEHADWIEMFRSTLPRSYNVPPMRDVMLDIAQCVATGEPLKASVSFLYIHALEYIAPLVTDPAWDELLLHLPDDLRYPILASALCQHINDDSGSGIDRLVVLGKGFAVETPFHHLLALAYYMEQGRLPEGVGFKGSIRPTDWSYDALRALQSLSAENFNSAFTHFSAALDKHRKYQNQSHEPVTQWFDLPMLNFLYALTLAKSADPMAKLRLQQIANLPLYASCSPGLFAQVLANVIINDNTGSMPSILAECFKAAPKEGWVVQKIANMLSQWMEIKPEQLRRERSGIECNPAKIHYFADATRLADRMLQSIRVKPLWEKTIEKIISQEEKETSRQTPTVDDQNRQTRLGYFFSLRSSRIETREQKRLKNGSWSAGKRVNDSFFIYHPDEDLDDVDLQMKRIYNMHRYQDPDIREVLPLFVGTNKLFFGERAPYHPCVVQEEKPFLATKVGKEGITLTSNVPLAELDKRDENYVLYSVDGEGDVRFFRVPLRVRTYIKELLRIGRFPLEAEPQLRLLFERIRDIIEIHSEMVEGGSTLPSMDGDSRIILQVSRERGDYRMEALVRPLPEGRVTLQPGKGDTTVFDQLPDGTRYQVERNKKQEKKNLAPLLDQLEQMECDEMKPCLWMLDAYSLLELMEWLPEQGENIVMEWPEGEKIQLNVADASRWNVSLKSHGGWFDMEGEVPVDQDTILSIGQLLELLEQGRGRFVQLKEGQYLSLTDSLRRQLSRIDAVAQTVRGKVRIPELAAGLIGDAMSGELDIEHPKKIDELRGRIRESQELQADVPEALNATLRDYQEEGFRWIDRLSSWGAGACLADDMGLGKTVQTIAFLLHKQAEGPSLVAAPASVVPNWKKEMARFAPSLRTVVINDLPSAERKEAIGQAEAGCVVLTTYGLLMTEEEAMTAKAWNVICLDEAHSIKNASTKTSAVCMRLSGQHRLILTGTPIQNHLGELWNLFQFINPGLLGTQEQFTRKFIKPIEEAHDKERQKQLKRIVQPFMLRRTKQEVVAELPDKQEITLPVQLSTEEMSIYELIRMEAKKQLEDDTDSGTLSVNTLAMITKLRMAACSASMVQKKWSGQSSKLEAFCDLAGEICTSGNRVLVFSQFTSFLDMAKEELERRGMKDYLYLDGSTPMKRRSQMVDDFQKGKCPLFIISLKAGGLGLNLTGANYVIHLDPWWNPAIEQQATDRAYRIGQEQKVTVYHLISEHTIEEKIVRLHQTKRDLADSLLEGTDMSHKLSAADLLDMIGEL